MSSKTVAIELSLCQTRALADLMGDTSCNKSYVLNGISGGILVVQVQCSLGVSKIMRELLLCLDKKG